jgi:hypothetical protein
MFAGARYAAVASTEPNCSRVRVDRLSRSRNAATAARRSLVSVAENSLRRGEARWSDEGAFGFKNTSADLCAGGDGARFGVDMGDSRDEFVALDRKLLSDLVRLELVIHAERRANSLGVRG